MLVASQVTRVVTASSLLTKKRGKITRLRQSIPRSCESGVSSRISHACIRKNKHAKKDNPKVLFSRQNLCNKLKMSALLKIILTIDGDEQRRCRHGRKNEISMRWCTHTLAGTWFSDACVPMVVALDVLQSSAISTGERERETKR